MEEEAARINPVGEKYASIATSFLEAHRGQEVDDKMIAYLGDLMTQTPCVLVGNKEAAEVIGVSKQRLTQLYDRMPPTVDRIAAGPLWLLEHVKEFAEQRRASNG